MPVRRSHGHARVEPPRPGELPAGVPAEPSGSPKRTSQRFERGTDAARESGAKGGAASRGRTKLSHMIEPGKLSAESIRRARTLRRALSHEIAQEAGGGVCGIAASLLVKWAAAKTAAAEEAFARGSYDLYRKLTDSARKDVLLAREHAAKEAAARRAAAGTVNPWLALPADVVDAEVKP